MFDEAISRIHTMESRLGLPRNFYLKLEHEDDWSFIIKLNALFEAASTHLLVVRLETPELESALANLDFGNVKFGKIAMLKILGCLSPEYAKFLQTILELRNKLAHNISYVNFTFASHLNSLDSNQKKSFATAILAGANEIIYWNCADRPREEFILTYPKPAIWTTGADVLISMHETLHALTQQEKVN